MLRPAGLALAFGAAVALTFGAGAKAQTSNNPYHVDYNWDKIQGRKIGVASGFKMDPDGKHLWIIDRCGANGCADSDLDPIIEVTLDGKMVKSFGKGLIGFPHGLFVDKQGNVWVTDGAPEGDPRAAASARKHIGHTVMKFSPDGKVLLTIGTPGVPGADATHMNGPTGVVVQDDGTIWVTDGHGTGNFSGPYKDNMYASRGGNNRLIEFSPDGKFIKQWGGGKGSEGSLPMQFNDPHDIELDPATGNMYIADRGNQRVQVIDRHGNFITRWTQFGKPSAIAIDNKGHIYVADGMSNDRWNPGWERGIRVGDLKTGWVKAFIPDELDTAVGNGVAGTEFLGVDPEGNIYSGGAGIKGMVVHHPFRSVD
jgi:DNA-binding beta-propeller fold protein YncE